MQTVASRRTFVRRMAVGLPVVVGTAGITGAALRANGTQHGMPMMSGPQMESVLRDLARIHNQLRRRQPTTEDLRAIGVQVRTLATYQLQSNGDAKLIAALREGIARHGRDTLLARQPDTGAMRAELIAFGFDLPPATPLQSTPEERAAALDRLLEGGLTRYYDEVSILLQYPGLFELLAASGDKCDTLRQMIQQVEVAAALMCTIAVIVPVAAAECFAATSVLAALKMLEYLSGCA